MNPIDPPQVGGPAPLGAGAFPDGLPKLPPGARIKNAPEGYWHGSVGGQVEYWRTRALAAEARSALNLHDAEYWKLRALHAERMTREGPDTYE